MRKKLFLPSHSGIIPECDKFRLLNEARNYHSSEFGLFCAELGYEEWMESFADNPYIDDSLTEDVCNSIEHALYNVFIEAHPKLNLNCN